MDKIKDRVLTILMDGAKCIAITVVLSRIRMCCGSMALMKRQWWNWYKWDMKVMDRHLIWTIIIITHPMDVRIRSSWQMEHVIHLMNLLYLMEWIVRPRRNMEKMFILSSILYLQERRSRSGFGTSFIWMNTLVCLWICMPSENGFATKKATVQIVSCELGESDALLLWG